MSDFNFTLWFSKRENAKKLILFLVALNLIAFSTLLFITANNRGPLYELIKPSDETFNYTLIDKYEEDCPKGTYYNKLVLEVIPLDIDFEECGEIEKIYLEDKFKYNNLIVGEIISIRYIDQLFEEEYIYSVTQYRNISFTFQ